MAWHAPLYKECLFCNEAKEHPKDSMSKQGRSCILCQVEEDVSMCRKCSVPRQPAYDGNNAFSRVLKHARAEDQLLCLECVREDMANKKKLTLTPCDLNVQAHQQLQKIRTVVAQFGPHPIQVSASQTLAQMDTPKESTLRQRSVDGFDDAHCSGGSDIATHGSDSGEDSMSKEDITVEFRCALTNEELCQSAQLRFDPSLTCGHLWHHLRECGVDASNKCLVVDKEVLNEYMKLFPLASVQQQLKTPPEGVLRIEIVAVTAAQGCKKPTMHPC